MLPEYDGYEVYLGRRIRFDASDHPYVGQVGTVVAIANCELCAERRDAEDCGYPDFIVELDNGETTRVFAVETSDPITT